MSDQKTIEVMIAFREYDSGHRQAFSYGSAKYEPVISHYARCKERETGPDFSKTIFFETVILQLPEVSL